MTLHIGVLAFIVALVVGILKVTGYVSMSWWWVALIWPIGPFVLVLAIFMFAMLALLVAQAMR